MRFKILALLVIFVNCQNSSAQFLPRISYDAVHLLSNPANLGLSNKVSANYLNQWADVNGSPDYFALAAGKELNQRYGFGFTIYNHEVSLLQTFGITLNYVYKLQFAKNNFLGLGLGLGLNNTKILNHPGLLNNFDPLKDRFFSEYKGLNIGSSFGTMVCIQNIEIGSTVKIMSLKKSTIISGNKYGRDEILSYIKYQIAVKNKTSHIIPHLSYRYMVGSDYLLDIGLDYDANVFGLGFGSMPSNCIYFTSSIRLSSQLSFNYNYYYNRGNYHYTLGNSHFIRLVYALQNPKTEIKIVQVMDTTIVDSLNRTTIILRRDLDSLRIVKDSINMIHIKSLEAIGRKYLELDSTRRNPRQGYYLVKYKYESFSEAEFGLNKFLSEFNEQFPKSNILYVKDKKIWLMYVDMADNNEMAILKRDFYDSIYKDKLYDKLYIVELK